MRYLLTASAAALSLCAASGASATVLTFDQSSRGTATSDTPTSLAGDYGDRVGGGADDGYTYGEAGGDTQNVQVGFGSPDPVVVTDGFGDLQNVLYERTDGVDPILGLLADDGIDVRLFSFDLATNATEAVTAEIVITDAMGIVFSEAFSISADGRTSIDLTDLALAGDRLDLRIALSGLADGLTVALDNVVFGQSADVMGAVPLPGAALLLSTGMLGLMGARRRR